MEYSKFCHITRWRFYENSVLATTRNDRRDKKRSFERSISAEAVLRVVKGDSENGGTKDYKVPVEEGMVVLDALLYIQANYDGDLAVRWNCKAAKCGSCSTEINGMPKLSSKTRIDSLPHNEPITVYPIKAFPVIKDLVTDVKWNYQKQKDIPPFTPPEDEEMIMYQDDVERSQEFRKCIENTKDTN